MQHALGPDKRLIGFAGKDQLKDAFDEISGARPEGSKFIKSFRDIHCLHGSSIDPVIPMLKTGGISIKRIAKETIAALIEVMKRQIATLEQEQLDLLLDKCYSYLTVPELAPVGIAVLERLRFVDAEIWSQIVQNGLDESPYIDLPLSIKKRIWASESTAFDHEVNKLLDRVSEPPPPTGFEQFLLRGDRQTTRAGSDLVKELQRLATGVDDDLIAQIIEKMVERAGKEQSTPRRTALGNLFHDFILSLNTRNNPTLGMLKKMGKFLDSINPDTGVNQDLLQTIRDTICVKESCGPVALLVASSYSRDFLADQLVAKLLNRRGPIGEGEDPNILEDAANHLRADPWIPNLTFLSLCNMRAGALLAENKTPDGTEVDLPFQMFYPLLINEMDSDSVKLEDDYFTSNGVLPNAKFLEMVQKGWLERRVMTSYCLQLLVHGNAVGYSRFRLVLDWVARSSDPVEEVREAALAYNLIGKGIEDMYSARAA